ncbi:MAG: class I SAM-dependent methyltransferase [Gammaproteobacteria bacterium]|nr:class I SAM-dependent methyltransferase [Gammaproteobacteria bacterium]
MISDLRVVVIRVRLVQTDWLESKAGQALFRQECLLAQGVLERVFGDQIVQIGGWGPAGRLLESARTQATIVLTPDVADQADAYSQPEHLAIRSDSVDAVLLPHILETSPNPHAVLREVHRILRPDGRLIVLGFNPFSWWGTRHRVSLHGYPQGIRRHISRRRLKDWLRLLNLSIDEVRPCYLRPPSNNLLRRLQKSGYFANGYLLMARKETIPVTVVRPRLGRRPTLVEGLVNSPTRSAARAMSVSATHE